MKALKYIPVIAMLTSALAFANTYAADVKPKKASKTKSVTARKTFRDSISLQKHGHL